MVSFSMVPNSPMTAYITSWALKPTIFAVYNFIATLFIFATIFVRWGMDTDTVGSSFSYFTNLTWWGLGFYHLATAYHGWKFSRGKGMPLERWGEGSQALHAIFYTTVITFPFLVTLVYWIILWSRTATDTTYEMWSNVSVHGLNSFFALMQIILPNTDPSPFLHIAPLILILALYLALAYLTHRTQGFYTYDFLDPAGGSGKVAGYVFGILAAIIVVFLITARLFVWVRRWLTTRRDRTGAATSRGIKTDGISRV